MRAILYFISLSIVIGTLILGVSQLNVILPYWSWTDYRLIEGAGVTAISTIILMLSALAARYYVRNELIKIVLLCGILIGFYLVIVLNIVNNVFNIWGLFVGLFIASLIIIKTMEKTHRKIASLADGLSIEHTHDEVDINTYLERVAKFKIPKKSSLLGVECFGYTIKVQDYLKLVPALHRYLNNSELGTLNELSELKSEAMQRDLKDPFNNDYVQLLNYILLSKNFLWEFESKWLQLKSRSEILKNTPRVHKKFSLFKKGELKQPLSGISKNPNQTENKDDSASAKASFFDTKEIISKVVKTDYQSDYQVANSQSLDSKDHSYGTVDHALLSLYIDNDDAKDKNGEYETKAEDLLNFSLKKGQDQDLNPTPNLLEGSTATHQGNIVTACNEPISNEHGAQFHEVHIKATDEQVNFHEQQAKLLQQEIGIRPSLVGELYLGDDSIKLDQNFDFDKSFELYFRRYYRDMSLRIFAFFQFINHTSNTKAISAHKIRGNNRGFTSREVAASNLAVNGSLYLSGTPVSVDSLKPLLFLVFMSGSTYLFMNNLSLAAFISYNGGYTSASSILEGMHWWAIALTMLLACNSLIALLECFKKTVLRLSADIARAVQIIKLVVLSITLLISAGILWPGQLINTIEMIHADLDQIKNNELSTTSGYINNRLFNERISKGVLPKIYDVLAIPVIGPRTGNKWVKLYLPVDHGLVISPYERLQVANSFSNDKRLHTKNVPRWSFKHTSNFKLIVQANKVDSTFIKKASIKNQKSNNKAVVNNRGRATSPIF